jgi:hypothetical protein
MRKEEVVALVGMTEALERFVILGVIAGAQTAAAFFEGVDPVTGLAHQFGWWIEHEAGRVRSITAVREDVDPGALANG